MKVYVLLIVLVQGILIYGAGETPEHACKSNFINGKETKLEDANWEDNQCVDTVEKISSDIKVITKGIVCSFCAQGIKKALDENEAVKELHFNEEYNEIDIVLNLDLNISDKVITDIVTDAGYIVEKIIR